MMKYAWLLILVLGVAGCKSDTPADFADAEDACGASALQDLVGENISALPSFPAEKRVRVIAPDSAVTMDHAPSRLNVTHDRENVILHVYCG